MTTPLLADRVQETTTTTGTGTLTLGGATTGCRTFNSAFSNGNVVYYTIDDGAGNYEVGSGTVGTGTLTRDTVYTSSNAGAKVSFAAGSKNVFCDAPANVFPTGNIVGISDTQTLTNKTLVASGTNTVEATSGPTSSQLAGNRNKIINGAMMIDQRNAGASVSGDSVYPVDRWKSSAAGGGVFSMQQSTTAPVGFANSVVCTVTTADSSIAASDEYSYRQLIEGYNFADLLWGTANAITVTLSFWVRSSVTGTYSVGLRNSAGNRTYPATYTISSANTWEYKTITISGDTAGTWVGASNGVGVGVIFSLGAGSNLQGTANSWNASGTWSTSTATQWIATNGATFYITGVQLEAGATATPFENRLYGTELALCYRYARTVTDQMSTGGASSGVSTVLTRFPFPVTMRATPTVSVSTAGSFILGNDYSANYTASSASINASNLTPGGGRVNIGGFGSVPSAGTWLAGSDTTGTSVLLFSAEL